jgi:NAD(P)-dependent dehydrogenase (short-subunit alcohol dehydrogenase family)
MPAGPRLAGKVAVVTGASKGIGKATALALGAAGANVVVNYLSSLDSAKQVVQAIGADRAIAIKADVSDLNQGKELVQKTVEKWGRIDILILNAGVLAEKGSLADTTEEDFDRLFKVNVKGPFFLIKVRLILPYRPTTSLYAVFMVFPPTHLTNTAFSTHRRPLHTSQRAVVSCSSPLPSQPRVPSRPTICSTSPPRARLSR